MQTITPIKVRGYHIDLYQHVNNARYLEFLEEARWHFLEEQEGIEKLMNSGHGLAVVNININFRRGAFMNEQLEIKTWLSELGNKSALIKQEVLLQGTDTLIADADVTFVVTNQAEQKAVALTGELKEVMQSWITSPEDN